MIKGILILFLLGAVFYVLYAEGLMAVNAKRAVLYVGTDRGKKARFSSCTGYVKRVLRFREGREYRVAFACALTEGEVSLEILDRKRRPLLTLDRETPGGRILAERRKRYYLVVHYKSATGEYTISIE